MQTDISLAGLTTFKTGGNARYVCVAKNIEDLKTASAFAKEKKVPIFILGGGSNVLVSDKGYDGLVVKIEIKGIETEEKGDHVEVTAGAGEDWDHFVGETTKRGYSGIENLSAIPGTVGASPIQNIGAYGAEAKDTILWVEAFNLETGEIKKFSNSECTFAYRTSLFKRKEYRSWVVTRVCFSLKTDAAPNGSYKDVKEYFASHPDMVPTVQSVRDAVIEIRSRKLPDLAEFGTAGSFFKNPIIPHTHFEKLKSAYPELPAYPAGSEHVKVSLAWILDKVCGAKNERVGDAAIYRNQALVIVNEGSARTKDVRALAERLMKKVKDATDISIEPEVVYVGEFDE